MTEITALGAAIAAGLAAGVWKDLEDMQRAMGEVHEENVFTGKLTDKERQRKWELWEWGVERSFGWVKEEWNDVLSADEAEATN